MNFADLYTTTVDDKEHSTLGKLREVNEDLTQKRLPKDVEFFPIYADQPDSYQMDLMFEPYVNSKGHRIVQALLTVININTKYAFCEPVDYVKNVKAMEERAWNDKSTKIALNNKDAGLVLRSFKRILEDMKGEAEVLNTFKEFKGQARFQIKQLYTDEGSEFKGVFLKYCNENDIHVTAFNPQTGTKRRLGVVERFNRTMRRYLDKQLKLRGKKPLKDLIPHVLDLYNRYLNHRSVERFFRRNMKKGEKGEKVRYIPAMMLMPGVEDEYIAYMKGRTQVVEDKYKDVYSRLTEGVATRYFKRNDDPFVKSRGSTVAPAVVVGRHAYDHQDRANDGKKRVWGPSIEIEGQRQRFLPYEFDVPRNKKSKNQEKIGKSKHLFV